MTLLLCLRLLLQVKVKVKVRITLDISPLRESSPQKRSVKAHVLKGSHSFTCTPTRSIRNRNEPYQPYLAAIAGTYLSTPVGWKAELAWDAVDINNRPFNSENLSFYLMRYFFGW